jgi:hypothetical protein
MNVVRIEISVRAAIFVASIGATNSVGSQVCAAASSGSATMGVRGLVTTAHPTTGAVPTAAALMIVIRVVVVASGNHSANKISIVATTGIHHIVATPTPGETIAVDLDAAPREVPLTTAGRKGRATKAVFQTPCVAAARNLKIGVVRKIGVGRMVLRPIAGRQTPHVRMFPHNGPSWITSPRSGVQQLQIPIPLKDLKRVIARVPSGARYQTFAIETGTTSRLLPSPPEGEGSGVRGRSGRENHIMN